MEMVGPGGGAQGPWDTETVGHGAEGRWYVGDWDGGTWGYGPWDTRQRDVGAVCEHGDSGTPDTSTQGQWYEGMGTVGHADESGTSGVGDGRTWGDSETRCGETGAHGWGTAGLASTAGRPAGSRPWSTSPSRLVATLTLAPAAGLQQQGRHALPVPDQGGRCLPQAVHQVRDVSVELTGTCPTREVVECGSRTRRDTGQGGHVMNTGARRTQ